MSIGVGNAIEVRALDVLFPDQKGGRRAKAAACAAALQALDSGNSRDTVRDTTGVVPGVINANLDVPTGSIVVLMGLSGSGKSSLLRAVNGLNPSARGSIRISSGEGAIDVCALGPRALRAVRRRSLAMVFQQFGLLPWATVAENVGFGLAVRGESRTQRQKIVARQLELVGLQEWADAPIASLSGGMQQRVGLARAFATEADILLMDEPFSALDPLIREHLQTELLELQARLGRTILFVSHDLDEALKLGSQIAIMEGGRIVQIGTADDIVFRPATDYVARFVRHVNPLSVLSANTVMRPVDELPHPSARVVARDCPVRELLVLASEDKAPIAVVEQGCVVGIVERADVLRALSGQAIGQAAGPVEGHEA